MEIQSRSGNLGDCGRGGGRVVCLHMKIQPIREFKVNRGGPTSFSQRGVRLQRASLSVEDPACPASLAQPTDFNGNCAMLHFSCGGAVGKMNTYCQVPLCRQKVVLISKVYYLKPIKIRKDSYIDR